MLSPLRILYLVHDVSDPAVVRRVLMLRQGGAHITIAGFRRSSVVTTDIEGCPVIDLGQSFNGNFTQRIRMVLRHVVGIKHLTATFAGADVIIARNLEMLALAVRGLSLPRNGLPAPVVYESLDIHRLLLRSDLLGRALRALEGALCRRAHLLITSSPAFISEYFLPRSSVRLPALLLENKVYTTAPPAASSPRQPGPPWVIGWFGAIRCSKSLAILRQLVTRSEGAVKVIIRGRPAVDQFEDFDRHTSDTPGLSFVGPYKNPDDLPTMYRQVHFTWAIDMFEEGQNSSWLLPNRLYEGCLHGSVPLAHAQVETGRRMESLGIGIRLPQIDTETLLEFFQSLTPTDYAALEQGIARLPASTWMHDTAACQRLVSRLRACIGHAPRAAGAPPAPVETL